MVGNTLGVSFGRFDVGRNRRSDPRERDERRLAALVVRACRGSRRAFSILWDEHAPLVRGILLSMVPMQDAEDLLQDVALKAFRSLDSLKSPARFSPWLSAIARNAGRNALVASTASQGGQLPDDLVSETAMPSSNSEVAEILQCLRGLPEAYREPLTLRLLLDLSGPEIAARTGLTPGSVRVNLSRGMKLLREALQPWSPTA